MAQIWSLATLLFLKRFQPNFVTLLIHFIELFPENFTTIVLVAAKICFKLGHCIWHISTMESINDVTTLCITHYCTAGCKIIFLVLCGSERAVLVSVWHAISCGVQSDYHSLAGKLANADAIRQLRGQQSPGQTDSTLPLGALSGDRFPS